ncbi:MAG TPA: phage tail protein I [Pyrinomonadaceae bacterium]|nr:phage tail protein I [Pyrinomonadaceae bacterium]
MSDSLLPPNATTGERALEGATARIGDVPTPARTMWNPETCPEELLPWLAWAFSVDEWDVTWSVTQKRSAIAAAYTVQRQKGTIGAVKRALEALGLGLEIIEWFQESPPGPPYTFRVSIGVDQGGAGQEQLEKLISVVNSAKNLRSHLLSVDLAVTTTATIYFAAVTIGGHEITIKPGP